MSGYTPPSYCLSLTGSSMCPAFTGQYINPTNLSNAWPFFNNVTDLSSFDDSFQTYLTSPFGFRRTKYETQLGCSNTNDAFFTLQYQQTFLCGEFAHISYSQACYTNGTGTRPVSRETCQVTCLEFAGSEQTMLQNATVCPTNTAGSLRDQTINKDFVSCTSWGTLATNDTATCVLGERNEPNCGFGTNTAQLCGMCDPRQGNVPSCCISNGTSLSVCNFPVALASASVTSPFGASSSSGTMPLPSIPTGAISPAASSVSSTAAAAGQSAGAGTTANSSGNGGGLSGGAIAGIVVGSVIGGLVLLGLLLFCCMRRRKSGGAAGGASSRPGDMGEAGDERPLAIRQSSSHTHHSSLSTPGSGWSGEKKAGAAAAGLAGAGALAAGAKGKDGDSKSASSRTPPIMGKERPESGETGGSSEGGRNLLSTYQDQYSGNQITPGSEVTAIYAYAPNLPDELKLEPDTPLTVVKLFDDGWAVGRLASGQEGAFPLVCVTAGDDTSGTGGQTGSGTSDEEALATDRGSPNASEEERLATDSGLTSDNQSFISARSRVGLTTGSASDSDSGQQAGGGYFSRFTGR